MDQDLENIIEVIIGLSLIFYLIYYLYLSSTKSNSTQSDYTTVTPQTCYNMIGQKNIVFVNTLSNDFVINKYPINLNNSFTKDFINTKNINKYSTLVLYCANYTCSAGHKYAKKLEEKGISKNKIIIYEGGIHEWSKYSLLYPNEFNIYNLKNKQTLNEAQLRNILVNFSHWSEKVKIEKYNYKYPKQIKNNAANNDFYKKLTVPNVIRSTSKLLEDKVCVVTGGTSGLGLATVYAMLQNGAKHVTLTYFNNINRANNVKNKLGKDFDKNRFLVLRADARTIEGNMLTFDTKLRKNKLKLNTKGIDCVDVNAGIFGPANLHKKHVHNISEDDYKKVIELNLNAYFLAIKYFAKQAIENEISNASIVCIKSIYGSTGSLFSNIAYQTSKHGVMGLVRQSAIELARSNKNLKLKFPIRVNAVSPTFTDTALTKTMLATDLINKTISNSNPTGKLANKEDIANAVIYLLSENSKSITGIDLPVDCGVLAESIPTYDEVKMLNDADIETLSCCGDTI